MSRDSNKKSVPRNGAPAIPDHLNLKILPIDVEPVGDPHLLPWILWYKRQKIDGRESPNTRDAKLQDLQKFVLYFHYHEPEGLAARWDEHLSNKFFGSLVKPYSKATRRRIHATLSALANWLGLRNIYTYASNPMIEVKAPKIPKSKPQSLQLLSKTGVVLAEGVEVFELLLKAAEKETAEVSSDNDKKRRPLRDYAILRVLNATGLRVSELCALEPSQIRPYHDGGKQIGSFIEKVQGKGESEREVFMNMCAVNAVNAYLGKERLKATAKQLFVSWHGERGLTRQSVWQVVKQMCALAEKELPDGQKIKAHPHSFRHERTYAMLNAGVLLTEAADELGHSGLAHLQRYGKRTEKTRAQNLKDV